MALQVKAGHYYSNGAYGRAWGVRLVLDYSIDDETGEETIRFRGMAGTCRRKNGECTLDEFLGWARHEVALNENSWQRVALGGEDGGDP